MGEIICRQCGFMNWHIKAESTGLCDGCGCRIAYCDSCNIAIPEGGTNASKAILRWMESANH